MKKSHLKVLLGAIGTSVIMISSPVQANFSWTSGSTVLCQAGCTASDTINGTDITATATGWTTPDSSIGSSLVSAYSAPDGLKIWSSSGLGVDNPGEGSPNHATDASGQKESILFSFSKSVELTKVTMGWIEGDADFSLLRYTGGDSTIAGNTYSDLVSPSTGSWELVDNYLYSGGYAGGGNTATVNPEGKSSSLWLVAALNSAYWTGSSGYLGNDFFKLQSLVATYTPPSGGGSIPEPSTLALMSVSFLAFGFTQRRRRKALSS